MVRLPNQHKQRDYVSSVTNRLWKIVIRRQAGGNIGFPDCVRNVLMRFVENKMRDPDTILDFGIYSGLSISNVTVPIEYIRWLGKRGSYQEPGNRFHTTWKVNIKLMVLARREYERRTGERWEG
jgi:hypothetical protein